jgi:phosphohistidine phosphatase SixA
MPASATRSQVSQLDAPPRTRIDDRAYAASDQQLLTVVRELHIATVVLVGHNPRDRGPGLASHR